jgi:hypothetical protein
MMSVDRATESFVHEWFDLLSTHAPVERLLPMVSGDDLEMVFPERTLRSHADFRDWYRVVGLTYADQEHLLEELTTAPSACGADLSVTVVWKAKQKSDGTQVAVRVHQRWHLATSETGQPVITKYRVGALQNL